MIRVDSANKVIAFRRWSDDAPDQQLVVVANFHRNPRDGFVIGFPHAGAWELLLNSDWKGYSALFGDHPSTDVTTQPGEYDGLPNHGAVSIGPYSVLVYAYTGSLPPRAAP
jgi:1,4-alpha-glucan branching enzyme